MNDVMILLVVMVTGLANTVYGRSENEVAAMTQNRLFHLYENACPPMDKCNTSAHYSERTCFCDKICRLMNDCCIDRQKSLSPTNVHYDSLSRALECSSISSIDDYGLYSNMEFYLVRTCPQTMANRTARRLCEDDAYDDQFLNLLVLGRDTGVLYRNIYCAQCWREGNTQFWKLELTCPNNITTPDSGNITLDFITDNRMRMDRCTYQQIPPQIDDYSTLRRCEDTINSECKASWSSTLIHKQCGLHSSFIRDLKSKRVYKNYHCALCNDVVVGDWRCMSISQLNLIYYPPRTEESTSATPSQKFIVDLNLNEISSEEGETYSLPECENNHVIDIFSRRCRRLLCPRLHEMLDDEDCDDTRARQRLARKSLLNSFNNCSMFVYEDHQYTVKKNGTVRINSAFHDFDEGSYLLVNGSVYICQDVIRRLPKHMFPGLDPTTVQGLLFTGSVVAALVGTIIHGVFYALAPILRTLRGKCLMSMDSSLLISEAILLSGTSETRNRTTCVVAAVFLHYFILAAFCWKNIIAYDLVTSMWRKRRNIPPKNSRRFVAFCLYGWFLPATITGVSIRLDQIPALHPFVPDYAHKWCWISNMEALLLIYLAPIAVILLSDLIMHLITLVDLFHLMKVEDAEIEPNKTDLIVHIKLFILMGVTWLLGYFGSQSKDPILWYLFSAFNAAHGLYMGLIHIFNPACRQDAWSTVTKCAEAIANAVRRFRRKRLKKNNLIQRKRKPNPVEV